MALSDRRDDVASSSRPRWTKLVGFGLVGAALSAGFGSAVHAQSKEERSAGPVTGREIGRREAEGGRARAGRAEGTQRRFGAEAQTASGHRGQPGASSTGRAAGCVTLRACRRRPELTPRRPLGPFVTQFRPMVPPFGGMPDPVELAIAFSDALGEKEAAKPALEAAKQKVGMGRGATRFDVDAASGQLLRANRKVRLLRNIITTARGGRGRRGGTHA